VNAFDAALVDAGRRIRHLHQVAEPLAEQRPDPLADAFARKALQAETDAVLLLDAGILDGYTLLARASAFEAAARYLRRREPIT
jgi:hypothetical protein